MKIYTDIFELIKDFKDKEIDLNLGNIDCILDNIDKTDTTIKSFIETQKIQEKLQKIIIDINSNLISWIKLSEDQNKYIKSIFKYDIKLDKELDYNLIIRNHLLKNKVVDKEIFELMIKKIVESLIKALNDNRIADFEGICTIVKNKTSKQSIFQCGTIINENFDLFLDIEDINKIYEGDLSGLQSIFHKLVHMQQFMEIKTGVLSSRVNRYIKEIIIKRYEPTKKYFENNKNLISYEVDAQIYGYIYMRRFLSEILNINIDKDIEDKIDKKVEEEINKRQNQTRIFEEEIKTVDEIFDKIIISKPELLKSYRQLRFEYDLTSEGKIRKRSLKELSMIAKSSNNKQIVDFVIEKLNEAKNAQLNQEQIEQFSNKKK